MTPKSEESKAQSTWQQAEQDSRNKELRNCEFIKWLSPSHYFVEAQLKALSKPQKHANTLQWVSNMSEFTEWRTSKSRSKNRVLWIRGGPGVGKSTLSAYMVRLLKQLYPTAIVSYFFCKSGQSDLMRASSIVRTLAHECSEQNMIVRSKLEVLKQEAFPIDAKMGIELLCQKVVEAPLCAIENEVYLILDGLDEADISAQDIFSKDSEIEVLLRTLGELCLCDSLSLRLLIVSRPQPEIQKAIPDALVRTIGAEENADDIQKYITKVLEDNPNLRKHFDDAEIKPSEYFASHAQGLFLWVDLVFKELLSAKSRLRFKQTLDGFSKTNGDLSKLYVEIFSRIQDEDREWVKEILRWVLVAQRQLDISELQAAVEYSTGDQFYDFVFFVQIECGCLLRCIRQDPTITGQMNTVQFVHETFRSFIMGQLCPEDFFLNENATNSYIAVKCIQLISSRTLKNHTFERYAQAYWPNHVSKAATSGPSSNGLLRHLHSFFTTRFLDAWINAWIVKYYSGQRRASRIFRKNEEEDLELVVDWLRRWKGDDINDLGDSLETAVKWKQSVLCTHETLGKYVGKAAAKMWIRGDADEPLNSKGCFLLALKYYWKRDGRTMSNKEELMQLISNNFDGLVHWADGNAQRIKGSQLAVAFGAVESWDESLAQYQSINAREANLKLLSDLGSAQIAVGNFEGAIKTYRTGLERFPDEANIHQQLGDAYRAVGKYEDAIKSYWRALENGALQMNFSLIIHNPTDPYPIVSTFEAAGDLKGAVDFFETAIEKDISDYLDAPTHSYITHNAWIWGCFAYACESCGQYQRLINRYESDSSQSQALANLYYSIGEFDKAIQLCEPLLAELPDNFQIRFEILDAYRRKGDFDGAMKHATKSYQQCIEKDPCDSAYAVQDLGHCLREAGDYDGAIALYQQETEKHPEAAFIWCRIAENYICKGDYNTAIDTYRTALSVEGNETDCHLWADLASTHESIRDYESAIDTYVRGMSKSNGSFPKRLDADLYVSRGYFEKMVTFYRSRLSENPDDDDIWETLYETCKCKGDLTIFDELLDTAIEEVKKDDSTSRSVCRLVGGVCQQQKEWDRAIKAYGAAVEGEKADDSVWEDLSAVYEGKGDYDRAIKIQKEAINVNPFDNRGDKLAALYTAKGEYDRAINVYEKIVKSDPLNEWIRDLLGKTYLAKGDHDKAIDIYQTGIEKNAGSATCRVGLSAVYLSKGDWDNAITACQAALIYEPSNYIVLQKLRDAYLAKGDRDGLRQEYQKLLDKERRYNNLRDQIHDDLMAQQDYDCLIRSYEITLQRRQYDWELWDQLGDVYKASGSLQGAVQSYEKAIKLEQSSYWLREDLGKAYEAYGDYLGAIRVYEKGIEMHPTNTWLRKHLGEAYCSVGDYHQAITVFESGVNKFPTHTLLWDGLGKSYAKSGDYIKAVEVFNEGIRRNPTASWLWLGLGTIHQDNGDYSSAITSYERALEDSYDRSFLWSLININTHSIEVDFNNGDALVSRFPWIHLVEIYNRIGDDAKATEVLQKVIEVYENAVQKDENELVWCYEQEIPHDKFSKVNLPKPFVYVILGDAYRINGDYNKAVEAYKNCLATPSARSGWLEARLGSANSRIKCMRKEVV